MLHKFSADQNQHVSGTSESPTGSQKHAAIMQIIQNQVRLTRFSDLLVYIVLIYQYHLPGFQPSPPFPGFTTTITCMYW
jgi:hypothetical protein